MFSNNIPVCNDNNRMFNERTNAQCNLYECVRPAYHWFSVYISLGIQLKILLHWRCSAWRASIPIYHSRADKNEKILVFAGHFPYCHITNERGWSCGRAASDEQKAHRRYIISKLTKSKLMQKIQRSGRRTGCRTKEIS